MQNLILLLMVIMLFLDLVYILAQISGQVMGNILQKEELKEATPVVIPILLALPDILGWIITAPVQALEEDIMVHFGVVWDIEVRVQCYMVVISQVPVVEQVII